MQVNGFFLPWRARGAIGPRRRHRCLPLRAG